MENFSASLSFLFVHSWMICAPELKTRYILQYMDSDFQYFVLVEAVLGKCAFNTVIMKRKRLAVDNLSNIFSTVFLLSIFLFPCYLVLGACSCGMRVLDGCAVLVCLTVLVLSFRASCNQIPPLFCISQHVSDIQGCLRVLMQCCPLCKAFWLFYSIKQSPPCGTRSTGFCCVFLALCTILA